MIRPQIVSCRIASLNAPVIPGTNLQNIIRKIFTAKLIFYILHFISDMAQINFKVAVNTVTL